MTKRTRVMIVSLGHPALSGGGTETSSYVQFSQLKQRPDFEPFYVALARRAEIGHSADFSLFRGRRDEILWLAQPVDAFRLLNHTPIELQRQAVELVSKLKPDVVHLHHYIGLGTDLMPLLREELGLPLVLTLHDYAAICRRFGMMLKTNGTLCHELSFSECSACFPGVSPGKFFLRKEAILANFACVDLFIAPSEFLAQRYVDWGIEASRIRVIENPQRERPPSTGAGERPAPGTREVFRLGYFGRYSVFKGIDLLLDAVALLGKDVRKRFRLMVFGFQPDDLDNEVRSRVERKLEPIKPCVSFHGGYRNEDAVDLMRSVDWITLPSLWWENSPMVIQEARAAGVPVLCSNIGGMREKVRPGVDGAHFLVGSAADLADKITDLVAGRLTASMTPEARAETALDEIVKCYRSVIGSRQHRTARAAEAAVETPPGPAPVDRRRVG